MSYLITGGTGFIGAYITRLLIQEGEDAVTYDVDPAWDILRRIMSKEDSDRVTVVHGDITDLPHLMHVVQEHKVERIIHMASLLSIASEANPYLAVQVNIGGTVNVLEAARILGLKKVVLASTAGVFGSAQNYEEGYIPNDAPHYIQEIYAATKSFNEQLAKLYFRDHGVDTIAIRFCYVYGVGQKGGGSAGMTEEIMVKPALGKPSNIPRNVILNWLYVEDAARAAVMASRASTTKTRAFNIDGDIHSIDEAVGYIKTLIPGAEITVPSGTAPFAAKYDVTPIREEIGFRPEWTMEQGVKKVIDQLQREAQSASQSPK